MRKDNLCFMFSPVFYWINMILCCWSFRMREIEWEWASERDKDWKIRAYIRNLLYIFSYFPCCKFLAPGWFVYSFVWWFCVFVTCTVIEGSWLRIWTVSVAFVHISINYVYNLSHTCFLLHRDLHAVGFFLCPVGFECWSGWLIFWPVIIPNIRVYTYIVFVFERILTHTHTEKSVSVYNQLHSNII